MTVFITLTTAGTDTGPTFNLYSDVDGFTSAFETGVLKTDLIIGYASSLVPDGTTIIRVMSEGICTNYIDIPVTLTTTTTTTIANPANSTLTFNSYESGVFEFTLSNPIYSTDVVITGAEVSGSFNNDCSTIDGTDIINSTNSVTILSGNSLGTSIGLTPFSCDITSVSKVNSIVVDGYGTLVDTDVITIDGTLVTISIDNSCVSPYICSLYTEWNAKLDNSPSACFASPIAVYTVFGQTITTGNVVYSDSLLSTPLSGYTVIVDPVTNALYNINNVTGLVGSLIAFCV